MLGLGPSRVQYILTPRLRASKDAGSIERRCRELGLKHDRQDTAYSAAHTLAAHEGVISVCVDLVVTTRMAVYGTGMMQDGLHP